MSESISRELLYDFLYEEYRECKPEELLNYLVEAYIDYNRKYVEKWYREVEATR